jgi:hypothetical protein
MFDINQVYKIDALLSEQEHKGFMYYEDHYVWEFVGFSHDNNSKIFWKKDFWGERFGACEAMESTFRTKVESTFNIKVKTEALYLNGQAHGQCGSIHCDVDESEEGNYMTLVYFPLLEWHPHWGGFTVVIDNNDNMHAIYPKPNSAVIFNSRFSHVGLEPTSHCNKQRVSLAYKFKILEG